MIPKKYGDKYFKNLNLTYDVEMTDIINMANQYLMEIDIRLQGN